MDEAIKQIEREYLSGQIGIERTGEIHRTTDIYNDRYKERVAYHFPQDRETHRTCPHCNTAYRSTEQHTNAMDRCPFCHHII